MGLVDMSLCHWVLVNRKQNRTGCKAVISYLKNIGRLYTRTRCRHGGLIEHYLTMLLRAICGITLTGLRIVACTGSNGVIPQ